MLHAAIVLSDALDRCSLVVFTRSGHLARTLSALRPRRSPIFAFTENPATFQNLLLYWGVEPFLMDLDDDPEKTVINAMERLKKNGWLSTHDRIVAISNIRSGDNIIDSIQLREIL